MHAQTENAPVNRRNRAISAGAAAGCALYLLTISGEAMLGVPVRWLLTYLGAATVGAFVPIGMSAEALAWVGALAPLAWSVAGLLWPGRGWVWGRRLGARRPSATETEALADAMALLRSADPTLPDPTAWLILDDPLPGAAVRGTTVLLSRALIESESLAPALAHELGHADSLDGRLSEALNRLALWGDPLAPVQSGPAGKEGGVGSREEPGGRLLWGLLRWSLRLAGGQLRPGLAEPALGRPLALARVCSRRLRSEPRSGRGPGSPPRRLRAALRRATARPSDQGGQPPTDRAAHRAPAGGGIEFISGVVMEAMTRLPKRKPNLNWGARFR
ncbi:MAG TPA: hypothetical protein VND98_10795 [Solirubrobacterales bacterium]|nr:hypothetical protein [Solirubrobacterales bacterium]